MSAIVIVSRFIMTNQRIACPNRDFHPITYFSGAAFFYPRHQCIDQRLRVLQVARIEALAEPAVNRSKQFARLLRLTLVAPEASEAHGGAEFPGLCLLGTGYRKCMLKI